MMSEYQVPRVWSAADSNQGKSQELTVQQQGRVLNKHYLLENQTYKYIHLGRQMVLKSRLCLKNYLEQEWTRQAMTYSRFRLWMEINSGATL